MGIFRLKVFRTWIPERNQYWLGANEDKGQQKRP